LRTSGVVGNDEEVQAKSGKYSILYWRQEQQVRLMAEAWPHSAADASYIGKYRVIGRIGGGAFGEVGLCLA
jgi:hypothetical protein